MYLHLILAVDKPKNVISGNRMTAIGENVHADRVLSNNTGNLAVEFPSNNKKVGLYRSLVL